MLAIALLACVGLVAVMAAALAGAAHAQVRAQGAADLAALVAAHVARDAMAAGGGRWVVPAASNVCAAATSAAAANGAGLSSCVVDAGATVQVEASIPTEWGDARARARAGPSDADS